MDHQEHQIVPSRRSLKRKLEQEFEDKPDHKAFIVESDGTEQDLVQDIRTQVDILSSTFSSNEANRATAQTAAHALVEFTKNRLVKLLKDLVKKFIPGMIGREIEKATSIIYPLQNVFIRKVKILKAPKFDLGKLMNVHSDYSKDVGMKMDRLVDESMVEAPIEVVEA